MTSFFTTTPPAIICEYKVEKPAIMIASWTTTQQTEEEIVRDFFKRSIAILDSGLASIFKKYPHLASN